MCVEKVVFSYSELYAMFIDGLSTAEMARRLYVSESTIRRRLQEFNLHRTPVVYDKGMYIRMRELGMSDDDIAYVFATTKRSLCRWKSRQGLTRGYNRGEEINRGI